MFKKLLALFVASMMILSIIPAAIFAEKAEAPPAASEKTPAAELKTTPNAAADDGEGTRQINTGHIAIDNDPAGGYAGNYVVIYNPSESASNSKSTGNMSGRIQTSISANMMPGEGGEEFIGNDSMFIIDVDAEMAELAQQLYGDKPDFSEPVRQSFSVGDTRNFLVPAYSPTGSSGSTYVSFKVLYKTDHCYVWTINSTASNMYPLSSTDAQSAANEFEAKYALMNSSFGTHDTGSNGDGRVHILYYNINEGWNGSGGYVGGYFSNANYTQEGLPVLHIDTYPSIYYGSQSVADTYNTVVHEYQHMIYYSTIGSSAPTWLNESMSAAAEEICYPGSSIFSRIMYYTGCPMTSAAVMNPPREYATQHANLHRGYSMYAWDGGMSDVLALYAQVSLFSQYLYTRYQQGNGVFKALQEQIASGKTFQQACPIVLGMSASDFVRDFRLAMVANSAQNVLNGRYRFALQPGYDPNDYYGVQNPYNILGPIIFTESSCNINGGGAITIKPVNGVYTPPNDADPNLLYFGITLNAPNDVPPSEPTPAPESTPIPSASAVWDFESDPIAQGFEFRDQDGDGYNWNWRYPINGGLHYHEGYGLVTSASFDNTAGPLTPDNWLITPEFTGTWLTFWAQGQDATWAEEYLGIFVSTNGGSSWSGELVDFTLNGTDTRYSVDLSAYEGMSIRVAIRHYNVTDMFMANVDYIEVGGASAPVTEAPAQIIDTIEILGFTEPVIGAHPDFDVYVPEGAHYTITSMIWQQGSELDPESVFNENMCFAMFDIEAEEGYLFSNIIEDTTVLINGSGELYGIEFSGVSDGGRRFHLETVDLFPVDAPDLDDALNIGSPILHFESTGDYPWIVVNDGDRLYAKSGNAGVHSSESVLTTTVTSDGYTLICFDFKAWGEGTSTLYDKCEFIIDGTVIATWGAHQNSEWECYSSEYLEVGTHIVQWKYTKDGSVNKPEDCFMVDNVVLAYGLPEPPKPEIVCVEINDLTLPAWGEYPDYEVNLPENAPYSITSFEWVLADSMDDWDASALTPGDVFSNTEQIYAATFVLTPASWVKFANDCRAVVNGDEDVVYSTIIAENGDCIVLVGPFTVDAPANLITHVDVLDLVLPTWGAAPVLTASVPDDAHYSIDWLYWFAQNAFHQVEPGAVFDDPNELYEADIILTADEGYEFAGEVTATINGLASLVDFTENYYGQRIVASIGFAVAEPTELDESLNVSGGTLHFESTGDHPWIVVNDGDRLYAKSGNAGVHSSESAVSTVVYASDGDVVSFDFKAWGEGSSTYWDHCDFAIDGTVVFTKGSYDNETWERCAFELTAGVHTLTWSYTKDDSINPVADCFMVDNVYVGRPVAAESVNVEDVTVPAGRRTSVVYEVLPIEALDKSVTFSIEDTSIATVDSSGFVIGVAEGTTTITVTSNAVPSVYGVATVTVTEAMPTVNLEGFVLYDADGDFYNHWIGFPQYDPSYVVSHGRMSEEPLAAAFAGGMVYGYIYADNHNRFFIMDPETYTVSFPGGNANAVDGIIGMAFDHANQTMYGISDGSTNYLCTIDLETGMPTAVAEFAVPNAAKLIAIDLNGNAYTINTSGDLYALDLETGTGALIGSTGINNQYVQSITYDFATDMIYWAQCLDTSNNGLYAVDPRTAEAEALGVIGSSGMEIACLYIKNDIQLDQPETPINEIDIIGFVEPVWGAAPNYNVTVPEGAHYTIEDIIWFNGSGVMQSTETFSDPSAGYYILVEVIPKEGYFFDRYGGGVVATINGEASLANGPHYASADRIHIYSIEYTVFNPSETHPPVTFPPGTQMIETVELIGFVEPVWGAAPSYGVTVPEGAHYTIVDQEWTYYAGAMVPLTDGDLFNVEGRRYSMLFMVEPEDGYAFERDLIVTINGREDLVGFRTTDSYSMRVDSIEFTVTDPNADPTPEPIVIDTVELLDFVEPVWGASPFFGVAVPDDANYNIGYTEWNWYTMTAGGRMNASDAFINEEYTYYQYFELYPEQGYILTNETIVTINGDPALIDLSGWDDYYGFFYAYTIGFSVEAPASTVIDTIEILGFVEPVWGAAQNYNVTVPEGANYILADNYWGKGVGDNYENYTLMSAGELFNDASLMYVQAFDLEPAAGYSFAPELTITINGETTLVGYVDAESDRLLVITIQFGITEPTGAMLGDVNLDGVVDLEDVLLTMRYALAMIELTDAQLPQADVDGDGEVTMMDCLLIQRFALGIIESFPAQR